MAVIKVYTRINWLNKSESLTTPLGKTNLNKMDKAINLIDDEVVSMSAKIDEIDTTKVSADQLNNMVTDVSFNNKNGVISITKHNGTVLNIDTAMEKIAVNFEYNAHTQQLILTLENGEKQYIDMSALITQYEFKDTDTIAFSIDSDGKVSASIKSGSITKAMLSSEVMSAITLSENNAAASAQAAAQSATNAELDAKLSQSYSVGKSGIRDGEDTDNSKYYSEQAKKYADEAQEIAGGNFILNSEKGVANGVAVLNANLAVEKAVADEDGNNIQETYAKKTEISEAIEVDSELSTTSTNAIQNKIVTAEISALKKETTVNLLNPTLQTTTVNGVTCTNNGDGTYTLNGKAASTVAFYLIIDDNLQIPKGMYKPICSTDDNIRHAYKFSNKGWISDNQIEIAQSDILSDMWIKLPQDYTCDNVIIKPMLTTNLNATYDDFVPYTGDTGSLNGDVADVRKDVDGKVSKSSVVNNLVTIESGFALDARQGKALDDKITLINNSLAHVDILYKYDDVTLICKQGHVITIYFDCIENGIAKLQDYLTKHTEYCPFKNVFVVAPVWKNGENTKYIGYLRIDEQGLFYLKYMPSAYPSTFVGFSANFGITGTISYVV